MAKYPMNLHVFDDALTQATQLALQITRQLKTIVQVKNSATLCVPGGTTPVMLFEQLSQMKFDWSQVTIMLNDERWVDSTDDQSNQALVSEYLLQHHAGMAKLFPYYQQNAAAREAVDQLNLQLSPYLPIDICILGMGEDGHTASLFPEAKNLQQALNVENPDSLILMDIPEKIPPRVSLTLPAILSASQHFLLIKGKKKRQILEKAIQNKTDLYPISHVLAATPVQVYYTD